MFSIFSREGLLSFLYALPAILICITVHEFSHAYAAYKLGDKSQKYKGRLTLSPFAHLELFGFISMALFGFGWGKPVEIRDDRFKNRTRDTMLVALAGPMSNLLMAIVITLIIKVLLMCKVITISTILGNSVIVQMVISLITLNVTLGIFNLLPIPPLDGSKILLYFLPYKYKDIIYTMERYSGIILIFLFVTNFGILIVQPFVTLFTKLLIMILTL